MIYFLAMLHLKKSFKIFLFPLHLDATGLKKLELIPAQYILLDPLKKK